MELDIITREEFDVLETDVEEKQRDLEDRLDSMEYDLQRIDESHVDKYEHESARDDIKEELEALLCFLIHRGIVPDDVVCLNDLYKVEERECNEEDTANRSQKEDVLDIIEEQEVMYKSESWSSLADDTSSKYTVWVGGTEVNAYYVEYDEACSIAKKYIDEGYDDVIIQLIKRRV